MFETFVRARVNQTRLEKSYSYHLDHLPQELVDLVLPVSEVSTFDKVISFLSPSTGGSVELEGPQKVAGIFEVRTNSKDLVDQIFNADDSVFAHSLLYNIVGRQRSTSALDLGEASFVDKLPNRLQVWRSPSNIRLR